MSIIESFLKIVDPAQAKQREEERKTQREQPKREPSGAPPPRFACRVCGHEDVQKAYCPQCLADTMEPMPPPPPAAR
jgi:hypothetical protein